MRLSETLTIDLERALEEPVARAVAIAAHAGQTDKASRPYIAHPARVAAAVASAGGNPAAIAAAWLHDVVEDTAITLDDLHGMGFDALTVAIVDAVTRREGESHEEAVERASRDRWSRLVKCCDVEDNMDPERLALLDGETQRRLTDNYTRALQMLR